MNFDEELIFENEPFVVLKYSSPDLIRIFKLPEGATPKGLLYYFGDDTKDDRRRCFLGLLEDGEERLDAGRFAHFSLDMQSYDLSFVTQYIGHDTATYIDAVHSCGRPWSMRILPASSNGWRITFGLVDEKHALEMKMRLS